MGETDHLGLMRDPRVAELITADRPAWLWAPDATRILWANAVGTAMFGAASVRALAERRFDARHPAALQVARLADALPADAAPRLERLRGFASGIGRLLTCSCARITLGDGGTAILIAATDAAGPSLAAPERVQRLFDGIEGDVAVFSADGSLIHATPKANHILGDATHLAAIRKIASEAHDTGQAVGETPGGRATVERLGAGPAAILVATLTPLPEPQERVANLESVDSAEAGSRPDAAANRDAPSVAVSDAPAMQPAALEPMSAPAQDALSAQPAGERRHPLRFMWQIDREGRLTVASADFLDLLGAGPAAKLGHPWTEVATELGLDPHGHLAAALASHDTFSGIAIAW